MTASGCAAWHTGAQRPRRAAPCAERRARSANTFHKTLKVSIRWLCKMRAHDRGVQPQSSVRRSHALLAVLG